ncbi:GAF domain-containing protein [Psychrosphaera ytuae]|uniref:GAF domain-containing protein n=1 Tax=Psychrosphaera ytuae TaxID=2820710 RepID=A0A975DDS7_9GAMM|nr:GAF domain-containing protein [Psychrosphaera ytuae]QTH65241.1 GAF domain-containing protein [Psychrosphaera ytuae]
MDKKEFYREIVMQASALCDGEPNRIANLANISAILFDRLEDINWAGFYLMADNLAGDGKELVLGPFQGKPACVRIPVGRGVCGTAVAENKTQLVEDVHAFEGHIACDAASNSEVVVPIEVNGQVVAVLDIDSPSLARFDQEDASGLELLVDMIQTNW